MLPLVLLCAAAVLLGGCRSWRGNACNKPQPYQQAKTGAPLKIPQGLDAPETLNTLKLPALNEPPPPPRKSRDPCLDEPPPFKVPKAAPAPQA
jgi:uncharacterized lipoprotein